MGGALAAATGAKYGKGSAAFDAVTGALCVGAIVKGVKLWRAGRALSRAAKAADDVADVAETGGSVNRIFSGRVLKRMTDDANHNFPQILGQEVLEKGQRTVISENYVLYTMRGTKNGVEGTYEIGVRPSASGRTEVITHWFFNPK